MPPLIPSGLRLGEEVYGVCLVYWLLRRGYEGPCRSLETEPLEKKSQDLWFPETLKVTELGRVGFPQPSGLRGLGGAGGKGNPRILGNHSPKYVLFHHLP